MKHLDDDLILLSLLDQKYFNMLYAPSITVEPPHEYFANFVKPERECSNHYELYHYIRNKEASLFLRERAKKCFETEGSPPGQYEGTMRGSDPCLPASIKKYMDSVRDDAARYYAFAVPTQAAADLIKKHAEGQILEVGAGNGYWANFLSE